ncbi:hypothetical protein BAE44_0005907 [Dichanthelium oligosanthes]|uniref:Uncharacterized protein n=1 Tax=Dichanthelium oligosanthes TaxID=888268 RepID=A0A1E5W759_9POAL|nr:hypothetical protein BAE44_0005907 [Dichanthelium oligosanthes]
MGDLPPRNPHRTSWPEVVGSEEFPAALRISYDRRDVEIFFLSVGDAPPPGFNPKRVIGYVNANQRVAFTPRIG